MKEDKKTRQQDEKSILSEITPMKDASTHPATPLSSHIITSSHDLSDVPDPGPFFGRTEERKQLLKWLLQDRCRLIAILGIGGMGKTSLAAQCIRELASMTELGGFDIVLWRSLLNAPTLAELLLPLLQILSDQQLTSVPDSIDEQLRLFLRYLRMKRVILVLDNLESILEAEKAGTFRSGYEPYGQLIQQMATYEHQSHLLLTSRERPRGYVRLEGDSPLVRSLQLDGLDSSAGHALLAQRGLQGESAEEALLITRYSGNPLALKLVADTVDEIFGGDIAEFLMEESLLFDDVSDVLDQQFARLSTLEQELLFWLAVEREATPPLLLRENLVQRPTQRDFMAALRGLQRRSLVERHDAGFVLQNVVTEYLTDRLVDGVCHEVETNDPNLFQRQALLKAQSKEYVRESQARLILAPIGARLLAKFGPQGLSQRLQAILKDLREYAPSEPGYAGGNILNLLLHLDMDVRGMNMSQLSIWQAHLPGAKLTNINFTDADLSHSTFIDTFNRVKTIALSPKGELLAVGTDDGKIRLWRLDNGQLIGMLDGHTSLIVSVAFSPDGRRLVSSSQLEETILIWEVDSGRVLHALHGHQKGVLVAIFSPDGNLVVSGGEDQTIRLWDGRSGEMLGVQKSDEDWVESLVFHPGGELLASSSRSHKGYCLWRIVHKTLTEHANNRETEDGPLRLVDKVEGHNLGVYSLAFNADGSLLASGSLDHTICLWDVESRSLVRTLRGHEDTVKSLAFSPDGRMLASGSNDFTVRLWDVTSGQTLDVLRQHTHQLWAVAISGDGQTLASGGSDSTVCLWDVSANRDVQLNRILSGHAEPVYALALSPDGQILTTGESNGVVRIRHVEHPFGEFETERILTGHTALVDDIAFSPDGRYLASASQDQMVCLWDVVSGESINTQYVHESEGVRVAFHPNSSLMAYSGGDTIFFLDLTQLGQNQPAQILTGHTNFVRCLIFSPSGEFFVSGSEDHTVRLWDVSTRDCLHVFDEVRKTHWSLAISSNGKFLASGGLGGIFMWDMQRPSFPLQPSHEMAQMTSVRTVAFSPDGNLLVSGGTDRLVRVWDVESGVELRQMAGHTADVTSLAFSPDSEVVLTGSYDGTIRLWHVHTGEFLETIRIPGPYQGMTITGVTGISEAQRAALKALGAVEEGVQV